MRERHALRLGPHQAQAAQERHQRGPAVHAPPLEQHHQRGQQRVGGQPAQHHAGAADDGEVAEAAEAAHGQGGVGGRRGGGRAHRGRVGAGQRDLDGADQRQPRAALLVETPQPDDAEVHAVAGDDAEQERGGNVKMAERQLGDAERGGAPHRDRGTERDQRAQRAIEQQHHAQHHQHAQAAHADDVAAHQIVLGASGQQIAGVADATGLLGGSGQRVVDDGAHTVVGRGGAIDVAGRDGRLDDDDLGHQPGLARRPLEVTVGIAIDRAQSIEDRLKYGLNPGGPLAAMSFALLTGLLAGFLVVVLVVQIGADAAPKGGALLIGQLLLGVRQLLLGHVQPRARGQKLPRLLSAVAGRLDPRAAYLAELRHQRVGDAPQPCGILVL